MDNTCKLWQMRFALRFGGIPHILIRQHSLSVHWPHALHDCQDCMDILGWSIMLIIDRFMWQFPRDRKFLDSKKQICFVINWQSLLYEDAAFKQERRFFRTHVNTDKKAVEHCSTCKQIRCFLHLHTQKKSCRDWLLQSCRILLDFCESLYLLRPALRLVLIGCNIWEVVCVPLSFRKFHSYHVWTRVTCFCAVTHNFCVLRPDS